MLRLSEVLYGVQPRWARALPHLPPQWQGVQLGEVVTDSRDVEPGGLFLALQGERTDGHLFLADVIAGGARAALVTRAAVEAQQATLRRLERPWVLVDPATGAGLAEAPADACLLIAVDDPLMAVQRLAVYHRGQLTPTVVGITGSVGKTSVKEVTAAVLGRRFRTLKSKRSFNSEATLPTSLLRLRPHHEAVVLEMGMWAAGEIRFLAGLARPTVGIVTNVGPTHLERLGSIEAIAHAKAELPESLPAEGWCILNADDPLVAAMAKRTRARVFTFGCSPTADLRAEHIESFGLDGIAFEAHHAGSSVTLRLPMLGRHSVYTAMAAASAGLVLGLSWEEIAAGLQDSSVQSRVAVVSAANGAIIIDDTYNAAPFSTVAALDLLAEMPGRKIAVLGDMLELGSASAAGHRQVGEHAATVVTHLVTVGPQAEMIASAARASGLPADHVLTCTTNADAITALTPLLQAGDYVLVKGSRALELEQLVAALQIRPEEE
ncbi:UDP-N-acetylmuramoyl-tripeptide--D-alanyl-D-alanine ligase [Candidatus Viridilinea mediisalina]|uniref:UDP-N-acetylmuramoyl-tripeptide--D-alanyl-D- alanine ligase n=1 Tax=Candidatus Viridilinea mediisalina TaxID=2024553 RepID=UPI0013FD89B8|nr:UDP-N-acetylmuramoyl-tripeptide--D-alanyl-D-alanine ligase [Candidatus Viridilinea mediisalina]